MGLNLFGWLGQPRHGRLEVEAMWQRLYRMAYSWCHDPHLAADLVQDTMAKALKKKHQLRDGAALKGWLFAILVNNWRDRCRRRRDCVDADGLDLADETGSDMAQERIETLERVRGAVAALNADHREVLTMVALEGMAYGEVARALGIPIGTVTSRLCRARAILRKRLGETGSAGGTAAPLWRAK